jgi:hypothetical protein
LQFDGTDLDAFPTTRAFGHVNVAGLLQDAGREPPCVSFKVHHLGIRQELDVQVPADLDQFG